MIEGFIIGALIAWALQPSLPITKSRAARRKRRRAARIAARRVARERRRP